MGYISKKREVVTLIQFSFLVKGEKYEVICVKQERGFFVGIVNQGMSLVVEDANATDENIRRMLHRGLSRDVAEGISYGLYTMLS